MQPNSFGASAKRSRKTRWLVVALVIILVLAINATWGWLYANKRSDFQKQLDSAQQTADEAKNKNQQLANELAASKQRLADKDKQEPEAQPSSSDYRQIPELGVQYKLTDETKNLTYSYIGNDTIGLSTPELITFGQEDFPNQSDACLANKFPSGEITMYKPGSTLKRDVGSNSRTPIEQVDGAKKVGDNYFVFTGPQSSCTKNHADDEETAVQAAKEAFNSLVPITENAIQ